MKRTKLGFPPPQLTDRFDCVLWPYKSLAWTAGLLADPALEDALLARCRPHLPAAMPDGAPLLGINARWRLYRYYPGAVYRPHVDGAWPGSGVVKDGEAEGEAEERASGTGGAAELAVEHLWGGGGGVSFFLSAHPVRAALQPARHIQ